MHVSQHGLQNHIYGPPNACDGWVLGNEKYPQQYPAEDSKTTTTLKRFDRLGKQTTRTYLLDCSCYCVYMRRNKGEMLQTRDEGCCIEAFGCSKTKPSDRQVLPRQWCLKGVENQ